MKAQVQDKLVRLAKLIISLIYFLWMEAGNVLRSLMGKQRPGICVALNYHAVSQRDRARFARQMNTMMRHAKAIAADHQETLQPGQHYVAVTIDDGLLSTLENAIPELMQRKIPAAVFVVPGLLGTVPRWTEYGRDAIGDEIIASADRLKELPADLILIGSHTMTHRWLPALSEDEARVEIAASRAELEKLLSREVKLFSFPYGGENERLIAICREAGYERVFTILPNLAFSDSHEFVTGRIGVNPTDWTLEFHLKIRGAYQWLPAVFSWKRKMFGSQLQERPQTSNVKMRTRSAPNGIY
jgi:peptidoglycan/xylan/chitin deacetylase (PgdA/CDA1 family)